MSLIALCEVILAFGMVACVLIGVVSFAQGAEAKGQRFLWSAGACLLFLVILFVVFGGGLGSIRIR